MAESLVGPHLSAMAESLVFTQLSAMRSDARTAAVRDLPRLRGNGGV